MDKKDLQDVLCLVKAKLARDPSAACGLFWSDDGGDPEPDPTTRYAVGEEDSVMRYAAPEG